MPLRGRAARTGWPRSRPRSTSFAPEAVLDLSDEPVLGYRERMELAAVTLARGLPVPGSGLPPRPAVERPPLAGARRSRSSAPASGPARPPIAGELARVAARRGPRRRWSSRWAAAGRPSPRWRRPAAVTLELLARARPVGRARRVRLPGGRAHDRRHDHRRPAGRRRPRGRALRHERPRGAAACRRSRPRGRDPGGQRASLPPIALGRRRHRRAGDLPGGVPPRLSGSVPPLAVGPCPGYHGWRTGSRNGERLPPRRASPGFPR